MRLTRALLSEIKSYIEKSRAEFLYPYGLKKFFYELNHYNRYGLYSDDIRDEHHSDIVKEAVRRLPPYLFNERIRRSLTAIQLSINKQYLPKNEWITYEEDLQNGFYLQPYIKEVEAELKEKLQWEIDNP